MAERSAAARLRELSNLARKGELPDRQALVAAALEIGAEALEGERTWTTKNGLVTVPHPEHGHAIKAVHVAAHIAGCLGEQSDKDKAAGSEADLLEIARKEFSKRGYELVKRSEMS
jgi:GTP cyclohydrolase FolE2